MRRSVNISMSELFCLNMHPIFLHVHVNTVTFLYLQSMFVILHVTRGTPYMLSDQGTARKQTQWEQLDSGKQFTPTKKFLTIVPIVL